MRRLKAIAANSILVLVLAGLAAGGCDLISPPGSGSDDRVVLPEADDAALSDSVRALYRTDAGRLALRHVRADSTEAAHRVRLPDRLVETFYNALIHVHTAESLQGREEVVEEFKIHLFDGFVRDLNVELDEDASWISAWEEGNRFTGKEAVDRLMRRYNLQVDNYRTSPYSTEADLKSETPLNMYALSERFSHINGVQEAYPGGLVSGRNGISATLGDDFVELRYSFGYGDCRAGCIHRHYWTFRVYEDGRVTFEGESGDSIPDDVYIPKRANAQTRNAPTR
jgi:hypothetical protein